MTRNPLHAIGPVVFLALSAALPARAGLRECADLVIADPIADPGTLLPQGAAIDVDLGGTPSQNGFVFGGLGPGAFLAHAAVTPAGRVFLSDLEADPSGIGPTPGTGLWRGAVFEVEPAAGNLVTIADGTLCGPTIATCGPSAFVDPIGLEWDGVRDRLLVVDLDADPSGFGVDSWSGAGHGAIYAVDVATGRVDLVADGSRYVSGPIPGGRPSIFEDPLAAALSRDGLTLWVVDQLAVPLGAGGAGAVFRVDIATGDVALVAVSPELRGLRDVAVDPSGALLVLDRLAGGNGSLALVDPSLPPALAVVGIVTSPELVEPMGLVVRGDGAVFVLDNAADPFALGVGGAVFEVDVVAATAAPVSAGAPYASPWGIALVAAEAIGSATPPAGDAGASLTVVLTGGIFEPTATVDFGPLITVDAVRFVSSSQVEVDITIPGGMPPQLIDVGVLNPVMRTNAFHCELFEVRGVGGNCHATVAMGPTLRVTKPESGLVRLAWTGTGDACTAAFRVRRSFGARPAAGAGTWPDDPDFDDVTNQDTDGSSADADFTHAATPATVEHYLVTEVGTDLAEGPSGHYGG